MRWISPREIIWGRSVQKYVADSAEQKALELPIVSDWQAGEVVWPAITFTRLRADGYNTNAAFAACVAAMAFAFPEPPPKVTQGDDPVKSDHPLQALLTRPNPVMSHNELMQLVVTYLMVGGNAYLHKVRNRTDGVIELWPYHDGFFTPVPGRQQWVESYEYDIGDGEKRRVPAQDIVHLKWPLIDLDRPWMGLSPLRQLAREVDADSEMTRMVWSLLRNDATPRTLLLLPAGQTLSAQQLEAMRQTFNLQHGGDRRGGIGIAFGGATVARLALNLDELDLSALRRIPETRIAAVCRVPAIIAGLNAGLERSTYSNYREARAVFTEDTLVPLWALTAGELEADLAPEFGGGLTVAFDVSQVRALQESQDAIFKRALDGYDKDVITKNEARAILGLPPVGELDGADVGDVFKSDVATALPPRVIDAIDVAPDERQLPDTGKARELKARRRQATTETTQERIERDARRYFGEQVRIIAENPDALGS
jgi:HK97 family phage portal protein